MEDEDIINLDEEIKEEPKPPRAEIRNKDLSEKVITTAKERDEAKAEAERAKRDAEFYKNFNTVAGKYQGATDFQDKIKEKVDAGYDIEDAAISILAKEGKFNTPVAQRESPMGGSATTSMPSGEDKPVNEMTRDEKRERLMQIERENPGSLSQTLRSLNL